MAVPPDLDRALESNEQKCIPINVTLELPEEGTFTETILVIAGRANVNARDKDSNLPPADTTITPPLAGVEPGMEPREILTSV